MAAIIDRYNELEAKRSDCVARSEQYAEWTLPAIFPMKPVSDQSEMQHDNQSVGARAVNHLSNKLVLALFAPSRPFFRLEVDEEFQVKLEAAGVTEAIRQLAMSRAEREAMKEFARRGGRTAMTEAMKLLLITGNALLYSPKPGRMQAYSIRDYVVVRDLSGKVIEFITKDSKALMTLPENIRASVKAQNPKLKDSDDVALYTHVILKADKKFHVLQAVENVDLPDTAGTHTEKNLPWIPLTWSLIRGRDYGIGLVEDYAGDFHALSLLSAAMVRGAAIAADIKFLVDPAGSTDVKDLNASESGAYVPGRKDDIYCLQVDKANDWNMVLQIMQAYEKRIGLAFLLGSAVTRDAERVTAEEIRHQANELETSLGGVYSRLAEDLQLPLAFLLMTSSKLSLGDAGEVEPSIVTGMDSLSRNGDLEALQLFFQDLAILANLPEPVQRRLKFGEVMALYGAARGVKYEKFMKDEATVEAEIQAERKAMAQQTAAAEAAKAIPKIMTQEQA